MKQEMVELIEEITKEAIDVTLEVIEDEIKPLLANFKGPAKEIGKPYEEWTPEDFQKAAAIFGKELEPYIANKEVNSLLELEAEEV